MVTFDVGIQPGIATASASSPENEPYGREGSSIRGAGTMMSSAVCAIARSFPSYARPMDCHVEI